MVYHGTYKNGVVVLDGEATLSEGQRVDVNVEGAPAHVGVTENQPTVWQKLLELSGVIKDGEPDESRNHDHYIYGAPKREPEE